MNFKEVDFEALNKLSQEEKDDLTVEIEEDEVVEENDAVEIEEEDTAEDDDTEEKNKSEEESSEKTEDTKESEKSPKREARESRAQKRIRELVAARKEAEAELAKEREEKAKLVKAVKESQKTNLGSQKATFEARLEAAEKAIADALENEDQTSFVKAQKEMVMAQTQLLAINNWEARQKDEPEDVQEEPKVQGKDPRQVVATKWMSKNPWYLKGGAKAELANKLSHLMEVEGLYDPSTEEFYEELDARLTEMEDGEDTNTNVVKEKTKKPPQTTAGGTQTPAPTKGGRKVVRLTAEDKRLASKMGIPLELYAKQKAATERNSGGYVEIDV